MVHFLTSDEKYRDLIYDHGDRSGHTPASLPIGDYRFGRTPEKPVRVHARNALGRVGGYLKSTIEAIVDAKLRRMERELDRRAIRADRSKRAMRESAPTGRS
jgi:hypothetical protein